MDSDIIAFTLGVVFKSLIGYLVGDILMRPLLRNLASNYPLHLQPFLHFYHNHEEDIEKCNQCALDAVKK